MTTITIKVRFRNGSYVTGSVAGVRAASTASAQVAAERLGQKLLGTDFGSVREIDYGPGCESVWSISSREGA